MACTIFSGKDGQRCLARPWGLSGWKRAASKVLFLRMVVAAEPDDVSLHLEGSG